MLLSKPEILACLERGEITIDPFVPENLGSAQYDVTLGEHCYREVDIGEGIYNPYDERQVRRKWQLDRAIVHQEIVDDRGIVPFANIGLGEKIILVKPGEMILAHTREFVGGSCNAITTMMKARSSMGRNFFEVCRCAGMGDVNYFNRWTMEIVNTSRFHTVPLVVGSRVAQLLFMRVAPVAAEDMYHVGGKYQGSGALADLRAAWTPEAMLPKQWRDRERRAYASSTGTP